MKYYPTGTTLLIFFMILGSSIASIAQKSDNPYKGLPFKDRIYVGGDLGFSFGSYTYIRIAPLLGYNFTERFSAGLSPSYTYLKDSRFEPEYETSIYGGSVFGRYFVFEGFFLQTEVEALNLDVYRINPITGEYRTERETIPIWFVGAGYSQRTTEGSGFFISVLYDLIQDINSPYPDNLSIRVGGFIGF